MKDSVNLRIILSYYYLLWGIRILKGRLKGFTVTQSDSCSLYSRLVGKAYSANLVSEHKEAARGIKKMPYLRMRGFFSLTL